MLILHTTACPQNLKPQVKTSIKSIADDGVFASINKIGKKAVSPNFILLFCQKSKVAGHSTIFEESTCYYGIKASKKIGIAAARNKIKRRLRHALRNLVTQEPAFAELALIIIPKKSCANMEFASLEHKIRQSITHTAKFRP